MTFMTALGSLLLLASTVPGLPKAVAGGADEIRQNWWKVECPDPATLVEEDRPVAEITRGAKRGSALDQYRLGLRYETGIGVPKDLRRAERLYRAAANQQTRARRTYSPAVPGESHGRVVSGGAPRTIPGASAAGFRLICMATPAKSDSIPSTR